MKVNPLYLNFYARISRSCPGFSPPYLTNSGESNRLIENSGDLNSLHKTFRQYRYSVIQMDSNLKNELFDDVVLRLKDESSSRYQDQIAILHSLFLQFHPSESHASQIEACLEDFGKVLYPDVEDDSQKAKVLAMNFITGSTPSNVDKLFFASLMRFSKETNTPFRDVVSDFFNDVRRFNFIRLTSFLSPSERCYYQPSHYLAPEDAVIDSETASVPFANTYFFPPESVVEEAALANFQNVGNFMNGGSCVSLGDGYFATNKHVVLKDGSPIDDFDHNSIFFNNRVVPLGNSTYSLHPAGKDLAIVHVPEFKGVDVKATLSTSSLKPKSQMFVIGAPGVMGRNLYCSTGLLLGQSERRISTTCCVKNGNSGGALIDEKGNVVGIMVSADFNDNTFMSEKSYAIPVSELEAFDI